MKRLLFLILLICLFLHSQAFALIIDGHDLIRRPYKKNPAYAPGRILVKYRPKLPAAAKDDYKAHWGITSIKDFRAIGVRQLKLPAGMTVEQALELYRDDPNVEYAEPDYYLYATAVPDDPYFDRLWGLHNTGQDVNGTSGVQDADIDAVEAWDIATGSSSVVVAVIDSGVDYNHPDLSANIWTNPDEIPGNGIDDDENGYIDDVRGWDFCDNDNNPEDYNAHGTHVAGTIAARGNNAAGVAGVCWTAKIMALRFLNAGGRGLTSDAISAIEYANTKGAHVVNNSWGGRGFSQALKDAINAFPALIVCAAGNDGTDNDNAPQYPSSYDCPNIIAVAATDQEDNLASFSNYGLLSVDVAAPGTNIYSTSPPRQTVWSYNFDDGDISDWLTGGTNNTWGLESEYFISPPNSLAESPGAFYQDNTDSWAMSPAFDLTSHTGPRLDFICGGFAASFEDYLRLQVSTDGVTWDNAPVDLVGDGYWRFISLDLQAYKGSGTVFIRFFMHSDSSNTDLGWFIDEISVTAASSSYNGTEYMFKGGTSMAAPHVSGLAALIKAQATSLTSTEIRVIIEKSVDPIESLNDKVSTGGRINVFKSLFPPAPGGLSAGPGSTSRIDLAWVDNSPNESGFEIERNTNSRKAFSMIATVDANTSRYSDTGLNEATAYSYRVRAFNSVGVSGYSNEIEAVTHPAGPSNLSASASKKRINLSWTDHSSGELGFKIERKKGEDGTFVEIFDVDADVVSYTDTGLKGSATYYYRVKAYNSGGDSTYSNQANARTKSGSSGGGGGCFIATVARVCL